jgi:serine/threonine protein kinase
MVDRAGNIYLTDFGIARHAESTTTTIGTAGTPAYMAPEQIMGKAVSPPTDIYSSGIMLFEMLTGQRPFTGSEEDSESSGATAAERIRLAHLTTPVPDPRELNPDISQPLAAVILRALEKDPAQRYHSTEEFMAAACESVGLSINSIPDRLPPLLFNEESPTIPIKQTRLFGVPVWILGIGGLLILGGLFMAGIALAKGIPFLQGVLANATATTALTSTPIAASLPEDIPTVAVIPTDFPTPTNTQIPTLTNTPVPLPTLTPRPTYTPYPPTSTRAVVVDGKITFMNKRGVKILVYVNGGSAVELYPNYYVTVSAGGGGTIEWCNTNGGSCGTLTYSSEDAGKTIYLN